jgi:hypothetical protein
VRADLPRGCAATYFRGQPARARHAVAAKSGTPAYKSVPISLHWLDLVASRQVKTVLKTPTPGTGSALRAAGRDARPAVRSAAGSEISRRLGDLGFVPGTAISVVQRAPLG